MSRRRPINLVERIEAWECGYGMRQFDLAALIYWMSIGLWSCHRLWQTLLE